MAPKSHSQRTTAIPQIIWNQVICYLPTYKLYGLHPFVYSIVTWSEPSTQQKEGYRQGEDKIDVVMSLIRLLWARICYMLPFAQYALLRSVTSVQLWLITLLGNCGCVAVASFLGVPSPLIFVAVTARYVERTEHSLTVHNFFLHSVSVITRDCQLQHSNTLYDPWANLIHADDPDDRCMPGAGIEVRFLSLVGVVGVVEVLVVGVSHVVWLCQRCQLCQNGVLKHILFCFLHFWIGN
jgi:hypothetical protein